MKEKSNTGIREIIVKNVFTYFNAIFAALAILLVIAGSYRSLTFLPVIIANALIGIFQQIRAKRILDKLTLISQSTYLVNRGGVEMRVTMDDLRQGDVITL
jgi:cation-transporting ATPase E